MLEEHLLEGLFVHFNDFFSIFLLEHITILPGSRIFLQNTSKFDQETLKNENFTNFLAEQSLSVKQTEFC